MFLILHCPLYLRGLVRLHGLFFVNVGLLESVLLSNPLHLLNDKLGQIVLGRLGNEIVTLTGNDG